MEVGKGLRNSLEDVIPEIVFSRLWEFSRKKLCNYVTTVCKDAFYFSKARKKKKNFARVTLLDVHLVRTSLPGIKS